MTAKCLAWLDTWFPSPWSRETQALIEKYAPADPERKRQITELGLMVLQSVAVIAALGLWGVTAWLSRGDGRLHGVVIALGWAVACGLMVGVLLHCLRYYDALVAYRIRRRAGREGRPLPAPHRWPRSSSDLDFAVQLVVVIAVAAVL
jgi:hypothetical protein